MIDFSQYKDSELNALYNFHSKQLAANSIQHLERDIILNVIGEELSERRKIAEQNNMEDYVRSTIEPLQTLLLAIGDGYLCMYDDMSGKVCDYHTDAPLVHFDNLQQAVTVIASYLIEHDYKL